MSRHKEPVPNSALDHSVECDFSAPEVRHQVVAILTALHVTDCDEPHMLLAIATRLFIVAGRACLASGREISAEAAERNQQEILRTLDVLRAGVAHEDPTALLAERDWYAQLDAVKRQTPGRA